MIVSAYIRFLQALTFFECVFALAALVWRRPVALVKVFMSNIERLPTLDDVAKEAGVSTATVSRCLNAPDKVTQNTRDKVMRAVDMLGYTPNFGARAMAAKRTFTIGAIIPTMDNAIFARGIQAFQEELHDLGYTLIIASNAYRPDLEAEQIRTLVARGVDGLLLIGYERDPALYRYLERRGIPTLIAWAYSADSALPSIGFDNRSSMLELTRRVLSMGHRRIAAISGIVAGNDRASERLEGIRDGMREFGLDPSDLFYVETPYEIDNGATAFARILQTRPRPTVIMCGNDVLAVGALQKAAELEIAVPDDVSLTGFDDIELARIASPPLTTVHVPHRKMGRRAARELIGMVQERSEGVAIELKAEVKMRSSLGAVPRP